MRTHSTRQAMHCFLILQFHDFLKSCPGFEANKTRFNLGGKRVVSGLPVSNSLHLL